MSNWERSQFIERYVNRRRFLSGVGALASIVVTPLGAPLNDGTLRSMTATGFDSLGRVISPLLVTWSSSNTGGIPVDGAGNVQALSGSQSATITATNGSISGNATVTSAAPVATSVVLTPATASVTIGATQQYTAGDLDQFGNTITVTAPPGTGGALNLSSGANARCASISVVQSATGIAGVIRVRVDAFRTLANFTSISLLQIDDGTDANRKLQVYLENSSNGGAGTNLVVAMAALTTGGGGAGTYTSTPVFSASALPAAGQDVEIYFWFFNTPSNTHGVSIYDGTGTNTLIATSGNNTANNGPLNVVTGNGQVVVGHTQSSGSNGLIVSGLALFSAKRTAGSEDAKPGATGDVIVAQWNFNDATTGTTPTTAAAAVGGQAMALTGTYAWTTDSATGAWNSSGGGGAVYSYGTSSGSIATINATGLLTAVATGTVTVSANDTVNTLTGTAAASVPTSGGGGTSAGPNAPAGLTTVFDSGAISTTPATALGATWTQNGYTLHMNTSPTINGDGQTSANLMLVPSGTGWRIKYDPATLIGGNEPVSWYTDTYSTGGTGNFYCSFWIRYSSNMTAGSNPNVKIMEPETPQQGSGSTQNNDVINAYNDGTAGDFYPVWSQQGQVFQNHPILNSGNGFEYSRAEPTGNMGGSNRGSWVLTEWYATRESSAGAGDGTLTLYLNGTQVYHETGIKWRAAGTNQGYKDMMFRPIYGGTLNPPSGMGVAYVDLDKIYVGVS